MLWMHRRTCSGGSRKTLLQHRWKASSSGESTPSGKKLLPSASTHSTGGSDGSPARAALYVVECWRSWSIGVDQRTAEFREILTVACPHKCVCADNKPRGGAMEVTSNTIVANALLPFLSRQSSGRVVTKLAQSSAHVSSCSRK
jgi:hypothetical protein